MKGFGSSPEISLKTLLVTVVKTYGRQEWVLTNFHKIQHCSDLQLWLDLYHFGNASSTIRDLVYVPHSSKHMYKDLKMQTKNTNSFVT